MRARSSRSSTPTDPTTLQSFGYAYDDAGNRTGLTSPQGDETYTYDGLDRLTDVAYAGGPTVQYSYDAAGNRTSETRGAQTTNYTYDDAGQLTQVGSEAYIHDEAGNLTDAGSDAFEWDHANRLTSVSKDGHSAAYVYDGVGVKTESTVDSDTDDLLVDRAGGLPTVVDDGERAYVHAGGLAWQTSASSSEFALQDGLGSVRGLAGSSGSLAGSASFEAFGATRSSSGSSSAFGFTGEPTDATGLVDLRARALEPGIGRLLSVDTVRPNAPGGQGFNLYSYVANNPATWLDPTGHFSTGGLRLQDLAPLVPAILGFSLTGSVAACEVQPPPAAHSSCIPNTFAAIATALLMFLAVIAFILVDIWVAQMRLGDPGTPATQPVPDPKHADVSHPSREKTRTQDCTRGGAPPGTIGSYLSLRLANAGFPGCDAHHIIQHAAVRDVSGYDKDTAPAIVLVGPSTLPGTQHYNATQAQRAATVGGTYGDERVVGVSALAAAGMPAPVILAALAAADGYFVGQLGLALGSGTRIPGDRWGYGR